MHPSPSSSLPAALALLLLLGACGIPVYEDAVVVEYHCDDAQQVRATYTGEGNLARITIDGRERLMAPVPAASGAKYRLGNLIFWSRGREALIEREAGPITICRVADPDAPARPIRVED